MDADVEQMQGAFDVPVGMSASELDARELATALAQVDAAHRRLRTRLAHQLGLSVTDLVALVIISAVPGCTPKALAVELGLTTGTVTSLVDRLVKSGQAERRPNVDDRRSILLGLTPKGTSTIETVNELYVGAIAMALRASPHAFNRYVLDNLRDTRRALDETISSPRSERRIRA